MDELNDRGPLGTPTSAVSRHPMRTARCEHCCTLGAGRNGEYHQGRTVAHNVTAAGQAFLFDVGSKHLCSVCDDCVRRYMFRRLGVAALLVVAMVLLGYGL